MHKMNTAKVVVEMALREPKKHSVRYDAEDKDAAIQALYVMNAGVTALGEPVPAKRIRVTIERIERECTYHGMGLISEEVEKGVGED